jgi:predicted transcriptional regulator
MWGRGLFVTTLKVGIATYDEKKVRALQIARGERRVSADEPQIWFVSTDSFAKVLSAANRQLPRTIADHSPNSFEELAQLTGGAKPNLSRTLKTTAGHGIIQLERGERGRMKPILLADHVELALPLTATESSSQSAPGDAPCGRLSEVRDPR